MTGSLQEKRGVYYIVLSFKDSGKWQQRWINTQLPTKDNKQKAKLLLAKTLAEYDVTNIVPSKEKDVLFIDFMYQWLETIDGAVEPNTHASYKSTIDRYIKPYFSKIKITLQHLEPKHIQEFYNKQTKKGLSATSVISQHANIRKALQHAIRMNMIAYNPADRVILPKKQKYHAKFYTADQTNAMLQAFKDEEMYSVVLLASFYGLRRSEVLGLKWSNIDFDANTVTIRDVVVNCEGEGFIDKPRTKTKTSHRTLPLTKSMREYLHGLKRAQDAHKSLLGKGYIINDYVCKWPTGAQFSPDYVSRRFNKVLKKANLEHIRFHDLRHSAASMLLAEKHTLKEIQEYLGHGDLATTADIYAHLQFEAKQSMVNSLENKLVIG